MAESCSACKARFSGSESSIKCCDCGDVFHLKCTRIRTLKKFDQLGDSKDSWKCDECKVEVSSHASRAGSVSESELGKNTILDAIKELHAKMDKQINKINDLDLKVQESYTVLSNLQLSIASLQTDTENLKTTVSYLQNHNEELSGKVRELQFSLREMQQYSRRDNVELVGVPVTQGEDIYSIISAVARALNIPYTKEQVSIAHRVPKAQGRRGHPAIVIKFVSRATRDTWLAASRDRSRQRLKASDIHPSLPSGFVFINEHLTPFNKNLLFKGRELVKSGHLKFVWVRDGNILAKKTVDSVAVRIKVEDDYKLKEVRLGAGR